MPRVTYIDHDGTTHEIDVPAGETVMEGAVKNGVEAIVGECGGGLACATCHCYVDEAWVAKTGTPSATEIDMLESASAEVTPLSRLSCQITVDDSLDGLIVRLPETQY